MEKPAKERQGSELEDSPDVEVAEEMVEDEPQKQEDPESQMQDDQPEGDLKEETRNETSVGLTDNAKDKSEQCEESMQNVPEELTGSTGMERGTVAGECQKQGTIQATAQMADAATEEASIEEIIEVVRCVPAERAKSSKMAQKTIGIEGKEEIPERPEEQQNVSEAERDLEAGRNLEQGDQPEQELQVQQVEQVMELVLEEAAICDARQERMEEAEDIEEPQKYAFREKDNK
ncbi:hypothetical protein AVEN_254544-1 [Araneus ventricosus]|uniref:Uncharacterized protein n=1 Tax=Araneus ventricosus TaxID=182803 RepID=A0A4Y2M8N9_ARAVE|nr:hypothetical protein AVEN_254544-1 [Araneus ventricosus]